VVAVVGGSGSGKTTLGPRHRRAGEPTEGDILFQRAVHERSGWRRTTG
jgi:ABC-type oligopeptide transport system ATPase subunit